jgi:hypothetical protein
VQSIVVGTGTWHLLPLVFAATAVRSNSITPDGCAGSLANWSALKLFRYD